MEAVPTKYNVIVVGGGHAGAEAAHACARGGLHTLLLTMNLDTIGQMSCNPAIGGIAKGHMVREVDALGGIMGRVTDRTGIHFKMLNRSRGPAVWAPRAQAEKKAYQNTVKWTLEATPNLSFRQDTCDSLLIENDTVRGIITGRGQEFFADYVILTTGTFLQALIHIGEYQAQSGRIAEQSAMKLSDCLTRYGFALGRLKTGTPPRVLKRSLDLTVMEEQEPDEIPCAFSYASEPITQKQISCFIAYTNEKTHGIIRANLDRSPMYSGQIKSSGPRYCPSIEDKIVRFADKERHQVFIEPEGIETGEVYLNGVSTSLPEEVQWQVVRSIRGMENAEIIRPGYAVEYDFVDPRELTQGLETRKIRHLYFAGQINGTTGYEEAAAQGLMAGLNVLRSARGESPFILGRGEAYIGVLVDDLVLKGVEDPYRMFTSRAEHRLLLRQDNADYRLMKYGKELGTLEPAVYERMLERYERINALKKIFATRGIKSSPELEAMFKERSVELPKSGFGKTLDSLLRRPEFAIEDMLPLIPELAEVPREDRGVLELEIKYAGYVKREEDKVQRREKSSNHIIPPDFDYETVPGIKKEAREKLKRFRPFDLATAGRISGVDPPDIDLIYIKILEHERAGQTV